MVAKRICRWCDHLCYALETESPLMRSRAHAPGVRATRLRRDV